MENEIILLDEEKFECVLNGFKKLYSIRKNELIASIIDGVIFVPTNHRILCKFVHEASMLCEGFYHDFLQSLNSIEINSADELLSLLIFLKYMEESNFVEKGELKNITNHLKLDEFTEYIDFLNKIEFKNIFCASEHTIVNITGEYSDSKEHKIYKTFTSLSTPKVTVKTNDILIEEISRKIDQFKNLKIKYKKINYDFAIGKTVISNLYFNVEECKDVLLKYFNDDNMLQLVFSTLLTLESIDRVYVILLFLRLSKRPGFLGEFYKIFDSSNEIHVTLYSLIFENYYNNIAIYQSYYDISSNYNPSYSKEDTETFKKLADKELLLKMRSYSTKDDLESFFDIKVENDDIEITEEAFKLQDILNDQKVFDMEEREFFNNFCLIGSPSISHFLVNLETGVKYFDLSEDSQRTFCMVFLDIFEKKKVFKDVLSKKIIKFGIVSNKVAKEFPSLFKI